MKKIDLYKAFFTQESKYYADKLEKFEQGKKYSFNFWAGLLGLIWFCYRKMYIQGLIILILTFLLAFITAILISLFSPYDTTNVQYNQFIIWILSFIILGFLGNTLYIKKSVKIVADFISKHDIENVDTSQIDELREKGGTSLVSAIICAGLSILLQILPKLTT